ncbi:MAG: hypothetical protein ACRCYX_05620 [Dermatophilaceae bacterium]
MTMRRFAVVVAFVLAGLGMPSAAASDGAAPVRPDERVVLVGIPGLAWSDVDAETTPILARLAGEGAVGSMTVRAVRSRSCAADGWLTLSAGRRAADRTGACRVMAAPSAGGAVAQWADYVAAARAESFGAQLGTLAAGIERAGACVEVIGPGAAVGAATPDGRVTRWRPDLPPEFACPVALIDGGVLPREKLSRTAALAEVNALVDQARAVDPDATLVVAGLGDGDSRVVPRLLLMAGPGVVPGEVTSSSTRQPGLVQLQDLTATLLEAAGAPSGNLTGRAVVVEPSDRAGTERVAERVEFETRAATMREVGPQVTGWLAATVTLWAVLVSLAWWRRRHPVRGVVALGQVLAVVPLSTFVANVIPWWRAELPTLAFGAVVAVVVAALAALEGVAGRRCPLGALRVTAVATVVTLGADVMTGSGLQLGSVFGQNPVVGGRFYGLGNTSFALYGLAVLVLVHWLSQNQSRGCGASLASAAGMLVVALAVEAAPFWGADFGGPPGLLLGGLVVLAGAAGIRLTVARVVGAAVAAAAVTAAVAGVDWLRPADERSHLGGTVQTIIDGELGSVLARKAAQNLTNLGSVPLLAIVLSVALVVVVAGRRGWRPGPGDGALIRGAAVMAAVGFAINDSGIVIPAFVAVVLGPLLVAAGPSVDVPASSVPVPVPVPTNRSDVP